MVRLSKQTRRRSRSPKACRVSLAEKTGSKPTVPQGGYRLHSNALEPNVAQQVFIGKVKSVRGG